MSNSNMTMMSPSANAAAAMISPVSNKSLGHQRVASVMTLPSPSEANVKDKDKENFSSSNNIHHSNNKKAFIRPRTALSTHPQHSSTLSTTIMTLGGKSSMSTRNPKKHKREIRRQRNAKRILEQMLKNASHQEQMQKLKTSSSINTNSNPHQDFLPKAQGSLLQILLDFKRKLRKSRDLIALALDECVGKDKEKGNLPAVFKHFDEAILFIQSSRFSDLLNILSRKN
jgi:hypothetical protein